MTKINDKIQESGQQVLGVTKSHFLKKKNKFPRPPYQVIVANQNYAEIQTQRKNVNLAIEKLEECLPLLQNYQKMKVKFC